VVMDDRCVMAGVIPAVLGVLVGSRWDGECEACVMG